MDALTPVIYLLSAGADPTQSIEGLARKTKQQLVCVSLGQGQEPVALKAISTATITGGFVLLQNCHLGLSFVHGLEDLLEKIQVGFVSYSSSNIGGKARVYVCL